MLAIHTFTPSTPTPAYAATAITVNTDADNTTDDEVCTLREALTLANGGTTNDECGTGTAPYTITFADDYTITIGSTLPTINTNVTITIDGGTNTIVIDGNSYQIFYINNADANVTLKNLTLQKGKPAIYVSSASSLTIEDATLQDNESKSNGGAIYAANTALTLNNVTLSSNKADNAGGGMYLGSGTTTHVSNSLFEQNTAMNSDTYTGRGGGLAIKGGTLIMTGTKVMSNTAERYNGGGLAIMGQSNAQLTNMIISGNTASSYGGGMYITDSTVSITNTQILSNTATAWHGGGIHNFDPGYADDVTLTLTGVTISYNKSERNYGGGIYNSHVPLTIIDSALTNNSGYNGGGIFNNSDKLTLNNVTVKDNLAEYNGGGLYNGASSDATVSGSLFEGNIAEKTEGGGLYIDGTFTMTNSQVISNTTKDDRGGGIYSESNTITLDTVTIRDNLAETKGGGIYIVDEGAPDATITNTHILSNTAKDSGGGIYTHDDLVMTNSTIRGNTATTSGGGMYSDSGDSVMTNITISDNTAAKGGGMFNYSCKPQLTEVIISGNTANGTADYDGGGGVYNSSSGSPILNNVTISNNTTTKNGGGMYNRASAQPYFNNVTISDNTATADGGGMYNGSTSSPKIYNTTISGNAANNGGGFYNTGTSTPYCNNLAIFGNKATANGGGIAIDAGSPSFYNATIAGNNAARGSGVYDDASSNYVPLFANSIIWGNAGQNIVLDSTSKPTYKNSLVAGSGGSGSWNDTVGTNKGNNIDADPLYIAPVDSAIAPTSTGNYRLKSGSPAVNSGDDDSVQSGVKKDLDGNPRKIDTVDMGGYERTQPDKPDSVEPADGDTVTDNPPTFSGHVDVTDTMTTTVVVSGTNDTPICSATPDKTTGDWSCTPDEPLPEGTQTVTVTNVNDNGGYTSEPVTATITIDSIAPDAPTVDKPQPGTVVNAKPTFSGTAEPGSTVSVKDKDGNEVCSATVGEDGKWECSPSTDLSDGEQTFSVTATDAAGNVSEATEVKVTVDPDATTPAIGGPTAGETVGTKPTVSGSAKPDATVTVKDGDTDLCTTTADENGQWSCTPTTALSGGEHTLTASSDDGTSAEVAVTVDDNAPDAPTVDDATPLVNNTTPTLTGTGIAGNTIKVKDADGNVLCTTTVGDDGKWSCTIPADKALDDGEHALSVTQTDPSGNESEVTPVTVTVDTKAPEAPTVDKPQPGTVVNATPIFSGTAEPGSTVSVKDKDGNEVCKVTVGEDGTWECSPSTDLSDGEQTFSVTATDPAGNVSEATEVKVTVDPAAFKPAIGGPTAGDTVGPKPTVSGSARPGEEVTVKDKGDTILCTATADDNGQWSCTSTTALSGGEHTLTASSDDGTSAGVGVTVDATAPDAPTANVPAVNDATPTLSGTGVAGNTIKVKDADGNVLCTTTVGDDGKWSCTIPADKALDDGEHALSVTQTDPSGNESEATPVTVTVDATAPDAPTVDKPQPGTVVNATPIFSGTAEPGSTVSVKDKDGNEVCSVTVGEDGTWECSPSTDLSDGEQTFSVTATDPAGNVSEATEVKVTVDPDAFTPAIEGPSGTSPISDTTPTISGSARPDETVTVTDGDGTTLCTATADDNGQWSCTVPDDKALGEGEHTLTATTADGTAEVAVTVDTTVPEAPTVGKPQAGTVVNTTPTISGTAEPESNVAVSDKDDKELCSDTADTTSGEWACTPTAPLPEGTQTITVTATDPAGNESEATPVEVTVDSDAFTPAISGPSSTSPINDTTPTISGSARPGEEVTVKDGDTTVCTTTADDNGQWSCTVPDDNPLGEGEHTLTATTADGTAEVAVTVDSTKPAAPSGDDANADVNNTTPTLSGTGEAGAMVSIKDNDGNELCTTTVGADRTWECTIPDDKPLGTGENDLTVTQTDPAGNVSEETPLTVTVDTTIPDVPTVTEPAASDVISDTTPTLTGKGEAGATVSIKDNDGNERCTTEVGEDGTWECTVPDDKPLGTGENDLTVIQTDAAGNVSEETPLKVKVDTTVPKTPGITGPVTGTAVMTTTPTISGTGEVSATVSIKDKDGKELCTTTVGADGTWECPIAEPLPEGKHDLTVTQTDPAGNVSEVTPLTVTVSTTKPKAPSLTGNMTNTAVMTSTPTISGTADPGTTISITDADGKELCTTTANDDGQWSCTITEPLPEGENDLTITATDENGITSESTPLKMTVDMTPPNAPVISGEQDGKMTLDSPTGTISGTAEPGSTVTLFVDGKEIGSDTADEDGNWSITPAEPLPEGEHELEIQVKDPAGNTSTTTKPLIVGTGGGIGTKSLLVGPTKLNITEGGEGTYTVRLGAAPSAAVQVALATENDNQLTLSPTSLTFSATTWNISQTVTVSAVDDNAVEGPHVSSITHSVTSDDSDYNGVKAASVDVWIKDNDSGVSGMQAKYITGKAGSYFLFTGYNLPPNSPAVITLNGEKVGETMTDENGNVWFYIETTDDEPGSYRATMTVTPEDGAPVSVSASYTIDENAPLREKDGRIDGTTIGTDGITPGAVWMYYVPYTWNLVNNQ